MYTEQSRQFPDSRHIFMTEQGTAAPVIRIDAVPPSLAVDSQTTYSFRGKSSDTDLGLWFPTRESRFPPRISEGDKGHEFWTTRTSHKLSHPRWLQRWKRSSNSCFWSGPLVPVSAKSSSSSNSWAFAPEFARMSPSDVAKYGTLAIDATIPTKPSVSMAQFVGELKRLPGIPGKAVLSDTSSWYKGLGSEYLNVVFGWAPFIDDLVGAVKALRNKSEILTQYHRDSGRLVRRRWEYTPVIAATSTSYNDSVAGPFVGAATVRAAYGIPTSSTQTLVHMEDSILYQYSFSGAYTYHVPLGGSVIEKLQRFEAEANRLLGTRLTPSVLWELAPWSWLIDWHGTIGAALSNVSAFAGDELVLKYGYLMRQTTHQRTRRILDLPVREWESPGPITSINRRVTKERVRANPYGFTLSPASYTGRQWAILGALGLTRAPRVLP